MPPQKTQDQQVQDAMPSPDARINLPQRSRAKTVWMVIAIISIIALIAVSAFGYYKWKQYRTLVGDLGAQINALNNQVQDLNNQIGTLEAQLNAKPKSASSVTATDQEKIKQAITDYCAAAGGTVVKTSASKINLSSDNKAATVSVTCSSSTKLTEGTFLLKKGSAGSWVVLQFGQSQPQELTTQFGLPTSYPNSSVY